MPPTFFSKNVDLKLIELVKEHPVLYNPRHPKYTDSDTREVTWQKIGDILSRPAAEFGGIQCQIHFGDFQEDKHKAGFIENLKEYLPEQYINSRGIEKKVLKEHSQHLGLSAVDAKHLYTKRARALPTYGVTFFLVKEKQKDKKKLVPRLLGINKKAILRLDEVSKEILQEWPLTHVKTYHVAKGEIFTLNFGDYSDKEYSVKTRDAYRIRDILEDYIDLIRKRMMEQYHGNKSDSAYIMQDNIQSSQANIVSHISHNPSKLVEHSFVGPSKIVHHEVGKDACQGTQIMTIKQIVVSEKSDLHQQAVKSEAGMRGDMSVPFTRRLNRLNSNSVKIVTLLTEPTKLHVEDTRKIVATMNGELSYIRDGVKDTIEKQTSDDEKKKLQDQMNELDELMRLLTSCTDLDTTDASEAGDTAMKVADLTTRMYFSLDEKQRRRSKIISRSRASFVEDENTQKTLRKASFIAATTTAVHAVDQSKGILNQNYTGPLLDPQRTAELEAASVDKLGKLNAAIAHYIMAHSDPKNVDYESAVSSMHTIHEVIPEFAKDAQALASTMDPQSQSQVLQDAKMLCDAIKRICSSTGMEDPENVEKAAKEYTEASSRLVFTFGKGRHSDKENELLDLVDEVGGACSKLLLSAQQLTQVSEQAAPPAAAAAEVDAAGVRAATACKALISQVQLTAPTISEPHCQSAVTASSEALAAAAQQLAAACRPLVEPAPLHDLGETIHHQLMNLARAMDRLKLAYSGLGGDDEGDVFENPAAAQQQGRLRFIASLSANEKQWTELEEQLAEPCPTSVGDSEVEEAQRRLSERMGHLNAAIASLLASTADRARPDYASAQIAAKAVNELIPQLVQDTKLASANKDASARAAMLEHVRRLCEASQGVAACAEDATPEARSDAIAKFTNASGKLVFGISHRGNPQKESQIIKLSKEACQKASQLVSGVQALSQSAGGEVGAAMDGCGGRCAHSAQSLLSTAQLTAASMSEPRCRSALLSSIDKLSSSGQDLASTWRPLKDQPAHRTHVQALGTTLGELDTKLDALKACVSADDLQSTQVPHEQQKLQFVKTLASTREQIQKAEKALDKPLPPSQNAEKALAIEHRLSGRLGELNAAVAALGAAADPARPAYGAADDAARSVAALLPFVVQDTQSTCANKDAATRAAMLDLLRELCEASRGVCAGVDGPNAQGLSDALSKYSDASGKLVYIVSPRANANRENQITGLTAGACGAAAQLLAGVEQLSLAAGGVRGDALDAQGAALAAAAQELLTTAQITSPTISEPHCKKTMLSSIDQVSASSENLADTWSPLLLKDPRHQKQVADLQPLLQRLKQQLETLRNACHLPDIENDGQMMSQVKTMDLPPELQKLRFDKTMSSAKEQLRKTEKELDKPYPESVKDIEVEEAQLRLSERMGQLNAAIASLLAATADRSRADYASAEIAINTVNELMPRVVQDTKLASANKDASARAAMLEHVRRLCEASQGVAACAEDATPEARSDAIAKFTNASGKLVFGISHRGNPQKESQIIKLSKEACQKASQLVSGVQALSQSAGGEVGAAMDGCGGRCAHSAQSLLSTAQLTAASMSEPRCRSALLSSIDKLSSSGQDLASTWRPLKDQPAHRTHVQALGTTLGELDTKLDALKACVSADDLQSTQVPHEQQKLQFVKTLASTREQIQKAEKALDKPLPPSQNAEKALAIEHRLSGRLGELNAAVAALGAAADPARPAYGAADDAARSVAALLPFVVQDTQSTCANKDAATRAAMLDLLRELCEASRGVCAGVDGPNAQGLSDALSKYSDASGKLVYIVSPRANANRENQITGLTAGACGAAAQLLAGVEQLSLAAGGARGDALDAQGAALAAAAQELLTTAQITSPTISEPHCKKTMLSSIDQVSASSKKLADTWSPLLKDPRHQKHVANLQPSLQRLEQQLETLRKACQLPDTENDGQVISQVDVMDLPPELQKLQFVKTISTAKELLHKAEKALTKPIPPPQSSDMAEAVQQRLSGKLGDLNAAIAALLAATADRKKPDYKKAEQAIKTISETMPNVIGDTQSTCANKDAATRAAILDLIRELCEASRGVCAGAMGGDGTNAQGLDDAVSKFSHASGKLVFVTNPRNNAEREKQIMALSKEACHTSDKLLSCVQQLDTSVEGRTGQELEAKGRLVGGAARAMLSTAMVTAPSMSSPACKAAMVSSAERVSAAAADLVASWKPLLAGREWSSLRAPLLQLEGELGELRRACDSPDGDIQITKSHQIQPIPTSNHKQEFVKSMSGAKEQIQKAQKALDKPLPPPQNSDKADAIQQRLSVRLGDLNAAIAALLAATSDLDKPDYKAAEQAAKTITDLMPYLVQDTQSTCANKDEPTRAAMLDLLRELCEASRGVCAGADGTNAQGLNDAVSKFSAASGKLVYVVSPAVNEKREKQIIGLAAGACSSTSQLLSGVEQLAKGVGGEKGQELDVKGAMLADAAQNLLATAQMTAPSLSSPACEQALQSSIERASSRSRALAAACQPLCQDSRHQSQVLSLQVPLQQLDGQLEAMRKACRIPDEVKVKKIPLEQQKLNLKKSMSAAEAQIQDVQEALARPLPPALSSEEADPVQLKLSGRLGELNAAIADLLSAPLDRNKPYNDTAEKAVKTIANLLPEVIQDTQAVSAGKDAATRATMLDLLRELCEASRGVCAGADGANPKGLSDAVGKFSDASGKLVYVVSPHVNSDREQEIVELSAGACNLTSQLLSGVQQLSEAVGGAPGMELDERGAKLADGAQALLASAQVTAPSISTPQCKVSLLSTIELVSASSKELSTCWQPLLQEPRHQQRAAALQQALWQLQTQLAALRRACGDTDQGLGALSAPSTPTRRSPRLPPPPAPPRTVSIIGDHTAGNRAHHATGEFLDRVRYEESQGNWSASQSSAPPPPPPAVMTDDEKRMHQQFLLSIEEADKSIRKAEETVKQTSKCASGGGAVSAGECMAKQARLQRNIALGGVGVAALVGANYADTIDYASATKSTQALPQLIHSIVEDGKVLSSTIGQESRQAFLEDMLQMCRATRKLCDAASNDREKLNEAAVEFGDKSTKLLYVVSNDVDPTLEKEIISRAKAIGDGVAQISVKAGEVAGVPCGVEGAVGALCSAGARCQDVAGKLIYTAKLVAPSIYEPPCQDALLRSADALSSELRTFSASWQPFASEPRATQTVRDLAKEAENLQRILEGLKSDVQGGRLGQRREIERLVVEDTPMRQLTLKIMEDSKKLSVSKELTPALRREYIEYCNQLSDALRSLDLANARCKRTPHDTNKRRELENAIQKLQMILLQTRPRRGDKEKSNIVDLRDFIDEVSTEADKMAAIASDYRVPTAADKKTLQDLNNNGQKISRAAYKLTHSDDASGFDTSFEDILDVDQFGQECDDIIMDMIAQIQTLDDVKTRNALLSKILPLSESCNMLRFATKSGISDSKSVSLESTLDDLDDIESRVIQSIVKDKSEAAVPTLRFAPQPGKSAAESVARSELCRAVCSHQSWVPRAPLTAYIASCAAASDTQTDNRNRLLRHLYKLVHLLKTQTVVISKRIATWQSVDDPEVSTIVQQILQEIQNPEEKFQPDDSKVKKILNDSDLTKLLIPSPAKVVGDQKQQEEKLSKLSTKLNSMCGALTLSIASPEALGRSAHAAAEAALELSAVARGCKTYKEPVQCERVEEAVQEMTFTTYGVLKTAELACLDATNPRAKRRLVDACRKLNDAIDKMIVSASSASPLQKECGSLSRTLALQSAALQSVPAATSALPFHECCAALDQHQEIVYKLKSEQPMTRQQFASSLHEVNEAVCKTTEISSQCAYLISVSEKDDEIAKKGPVDVPQIQQTIESLQDSCMAIIGAPNVAQAKEETDDLHKRVQDFSRALDEAQLKVKEGGAKATLTRAKGGVTTSAATLWDCLREEDDMDKVTTSAVNLLEEVNRSHSLIERCPLVPSAGEMSAETKARCDELCNNSKILLSHTMALVRDVDGHDDDDEMLTWVTFSTNKTKLLDAYDALLKSIRVNGQRAGIIEGSPEDEVDEDAENKTYLDVQVDLANKWLLKPMCKVEVKTNGQQAVRHVIDIATKMSEELKGSEREDIRHLITETEELLAQCSVRYDNEKYSVLVDRIKELKKSIHRGVVTRVVEDFIEDSAADVLDRLVDEEEDELKRKFLLERKIAELLAQLGRVTRTARFVADAGGSQSVSAEIVRCTEQTELLAPMLVQAAQNRIASPNDQTVIANYKALLAKYAESVSKVRSVCDCAVDPMDFVQTAGETMQRMREESSADNDVEKGHRTSEAIIKLANRSIEVSMSSPAVRRDPDLRLELQAVQRRLRAATPAADTRRSRLPDWKESTAEVLRTTGEVESALGGENIFKKLPTAQGTNQQIYSVARELHESVREWSARDNEIVSVARRTAVLMARLSEYVETDKKQALISTSKSIVLESHEVAVLARKLAHECTDLRIKTNLLQTCERIPTISAQLKMLTAVKGSSLGQQGSKEDTEAMDMLVVNAQSLMLSIQEVVKAAAGASVKIMSQRGPRLRWVRKNYY